MLVVIPLKIKLKNNENQITEMVFKIKNDRPKFFFFFGFTLVEGQRRNVTSLFGMNFNRNSFITNCFGET